MLSGMRTCREKRKGFLQVQLAENRVGDNVYTILPHRGVAYFSEFVFIFMLTKNKGVLSLLTKHISPEDLSEAGIHCF